MGWPKFRMCSIKNVKRKKAQLRSLVVSVSRHLVNVSVTPGNLTISVVPKIQQLVVLLRTQGLKASWVVAAEVPLILCKMVVPSCTTPTVLITISILETLNWSVSALGTVITVDLLPQLSKISATLCGTEVKRTTEGITDSVTTKYLVLFSVYHFVYLCLIDICKSGTIKITLLF